MKLLIITQKVDILDSNLGFFHHWIEEFAKTCESVEVVALGVGEYHLPPNVRVHSLGKEGGESKLKYLFRFYKYIFSLRNNYDAVFVHMNPEYAILGGIFWRLLGKRVSLWYLHKAVNLRLRLAEKFAHTIFSASNESFRLSSKKLRIVGHGIDVDLFSPSGTTRETNFVITVGRMSASKRVAEIVETVELAKKRVPDIKLEIIGTPDNIVQNKNLPDYYRRASLFINLSTTGSLDKAVLEALACECPVLTTNEAFKSLGADVYTDKQTVEELSELVIERLQTASHKSYRQWVVENHSLAKLIPKIIAELGYGISK